MQLLHQLHPLAPQRRSPVSYPEPQTASFEITPRCVLFAQSKLALNEVYTISFMLINKSSSQQTIRIEPIPNHEDVHFRIAISEDGFPLFPP